MLGFIAHHNNNDFKVLESSSVTINKSVLDNKMALKSFVLHCPQGWQRNNNSLIAVLCKKRCLEIT